MDCGSLTDYVLMIIYAIISVLFALVVPDNATEAHLKILALLAAMFKEDDMRAHLREAKSPEDVMQLIREWQNQN